MKVSLWHVKPSLCSELLLHHVNKFFIMRNNHQLEVMLRCSSTNNLSQSNSQPLLVSMIQVRRRFYKAKSKVLKEDKIAVLETILPE
jgi:hypothetical protein